jgi:hypothetical protein
MLDISDSRLAVKVPPCNLLDAPQIAIGSLVRLFVPGRS